MAEPSGGKTPLVKIYGRLGSAEAYQLRDFLHRCDVPFEWIALESDAPARLPVCEFPDGTRMESPTIRQVTEKLGWFANPSRAEYDLAIYGAGPAGPGDPRPRHIRRWRCAPRLGEAGCFRGGRGRHGGRVRAPLPRQRLGSPLCQTQTLVAIPHCRPHISVTRPPSA